MLNLYHWFRRPQGQGAIYSTKEFRAIIDSECERADRYGQRLSLGVFEVGSLDENSVAVRRLVRTLHRRFRDIDELGWYSIRQIGVILPYTPTKGAWKLAEDVCSLIASISVPPPFTIYTYPSENWPSSMKSKFWRFLNFLIRQRQLLGTYSIYSGEEFRAVLELERERADRSDHIFSLVIFDLSLLGTEVISIRNFVRMLNLRLRDTDEIGWYDKHRIGVILLYASEENANRMAENFCKQASINQSNIYTVYTYPTNWFPGDIDNSTRHNTGYIVTEKDTSNLNSISPPLTSTVDENITYPVKTIEEQPKASEKNIREFEPLLGRPIPIWKRGIDMIGSLIGIVLLSPVFLLTAILIKIVSPGPVIFRQERVGYQRKHFTLFKFRTMRINTGTSFHSQYVRRLISEDGDEKPMTKLEHDPRIYLLGSILRRTAIDELPQLINVLQGEMSLVGPRPCLPYEADEYLRWHTRRFDIVPGITGLWQVSGKNRTTFKEMIRLDIKYEKQRSFWLDVKILLITVPSVISQFFDKYRKKKVQ